jgi:hypothetical protein
MVKAVAEIENKSDKGPYWKKPLGLRRKEEEQGDAAEYRRWRN